ncbi:MAG: hypothetical protein DMD74_01795 [Gemmatimonadetes bacterium]|nr:MAG: hypothetical protein DMD74_01795 [Gemmatimonadota bacterium]
MTGTTVQPSLWHVLQPKWRTVRQRLREARERGGWGRLTILLTAGGLFWLGVYGVLFRILKYFRGVEELGPLLAGKLLGLVLLAFVSILILSNVITALSSFFLAKDLDLLVSAPVDWLRLYLAKLWETVIHSSRPAVDHRAGCGGRRHPRVPPDPPRAAGASGGVPQPAGLRHSVADADVAVPAE